MKGKELPDRMVSVFKPRPPRTMETEAPPREIPPAAQAGEMKVSPPIAEKPKTPPVTTEPAAPPIRPEPERVGEGAPVLRRTERIHANIDTDLLEYMDQILFTGMGRKGTRTDFLRALLVCAKESKIDLSGCTSFHQVVERMRQSLGRKA